MHVAYIIQQKRRGPKLLQLEKSTELFYYSKEEAEEALDDMDKGIRDNFEVVQVMVCLARDTEEVEKLWELDRVLD
jgi:hypothetical protein